MWENLIAFLIAVWQIHVATTGLYFRGHNFTETLIVVILGSSLGVATCYYSPEIITFCRLLKKPLLPKINSAKPLSISSYYELIDFLKHWLVKISRYSRENLLRQIGIFIITAIPVPNFELIAIAVSRLLKIPYGFQIIMIANMVRVLLLTGGIYYFGEKFCHIF